MIRLEKPMSALELQFVKSLGRRKQICQRKKLDEALKQLVKEGAIKEQQITSGVYYFKPGQGPDLEMLERNRKGNLFLKQNIK